MLSRARPWERSPLLTFPVVGAVALGMGILASGEGWSILLLLLLGTLGLGLCQLTRRPLLLAALLLAPVGAARLAAVQAVPDALAGRDGSTVTLTGYYDGHFLDSSAARVTLSLGGERLQPGRYQVSGELTAVAAARNPGAFDYRLWLERRSVQHRLRPERIEHLPGEGLLPAVRAYLRSGLTAGLPAGPAALMTGISLGDTGDLSGLPEAAASLTWRDAFARSGLAHVLALSGQQVSLLVLSLGFLTRRLGLARYPLLAAFLGLYVLVVGPSPSVLRAALMGAAVLLGLYLGRGRPEPLPLLALSAIPALLLEPRWVWDTGFQLSYGAVLGLIVFTPPLARWARRLPRVAGWLAVPLGVTLAAQAFTLPLAAGSFGQVPLASPLANLAAGPLVALLVPLGFLTAVLGPTLGATLNLVVGPLAGLLLTTARLGAAIPTLPWGSVAASGWLAYLAAVTALALWAHGRLRPHRALLVVLAAIAATTLAGKRPHADLTVLDVGQGDSILLRLPGGNVLVDGGGTLFGDYDVGERTVLPALRAMGVRSLRAVVATHADADHIEGLRAVLEALPVGVLVVGHPKAVGSDRAWDALVASASANGVPVQPIRAGQSWEAGDTTLRFLAPGQTAREADNENSVAMTVEYRGRRALLLGDTPSDLEVGLHPGPVDLLVVAHHGSGHSTSEALLARTRPGAAVISVGHNGYGHPADEVLSRLSKHGVNLYHTDRDGAVRFDLSSGAVTTTVPARPPSERVSRL